MKSNWHEIKWPGSCHWPFPGNSLSFQFSSVLNSILMTFRDLCWPYRHSFDRIKTLMLIQRFDFSENHRFCYRLQILRLYLIGLWQLLSVYLSSILCSIAGNILISLKWTLLKLSKRPYCNPNWIMTQTCRQVKFVCFLVSILKIHG